MGQKPRGADIPADAPFPEVEIPGGLLPEVVEVWERLAPFAIRERTLTPQTADRFALLCRAVIRERQMDAKIQDDGFTVINITTDVASSEQHRQIKPHPLLSAQRGMMQRVEAGLAAFKLAPTGRPIPPTDRGDKPKNALEALQFKARAVG